MRVTPESAARLDIAIDDILRDGSAPGATDDADLVLTARLLFDALPRFHPRFSFEAHLARRLAEARRLSGESAVPTPLPLRAARTEAASAIASHPEADRRRRSLVAGGAIASGVSLAIPIAGAAFVVWRRTRSSGGLL